MLLAKALNEQKCILIGEDDPVNNPENYFEDDICKDCGFCWFTEEEFNEYEKLWRQLEGYQAYELYLTQEAQKVFSNEDRYEMGILVGKEVSGVPNDFCFVSLLKRHLILLKKKE